MASPVRSSDHNTFTNNPDEIPLSTVGKQKIHSYLSNTDAVSFMAVTHTIAKMWKDTLSTHTALIIAREQLKTSYLSTWHALISCQPPIRPPILNNTLNALNETHRNALNALEALKPLAQADAATYFQKLNETTMIYIAAQKQALEVIPQPLSVQPAPKPAHPPLLRGRRLTGSPPQDPQGVQRAVGILNQLHAIPPTGTMSPDDRRPLHEDESGND